MLHKRYNQSVEEYNNRVCRFVDKLVRDTVVAKDITQETYLRLWEKRASVNFDKVRAWLFTTAYRLSMDHLNKQKRFDNFDQLPERWIEQENTDLKKIVNDSLALLTDQQRSIVLLKDYEGYSYQEIGEILTLSDSQVKVYLFRARQIIKSYIGDLRLVL
ncbi:RNA polymerase sigma factor [Cytophaga aurantiaca]|uniref:RNA polymerase sigma factor n=1 Tax=Cytophaga aurantiaca TaxID=29530 RepID=UPI00035DDC48|nr:sigma-70 family RNA polymerase sigma factor [Cytophaga aurantiaca]